MPLVPGARSFLLNGLMESDLDANNHKLWNLDTSNLNLGSPHNFPAIPHQWINSYNSTTLNFGSTQPATTDLSDFPSQTGHASQFLFTNGSAMSWATPNTGGFLNVKQAPFNAVGDGVHDDTAAINAALQAGSGGLTVYFPKGTYLITSAIVTPYGASLLGDNPWQCTLKFAQGITGVAMLFGPYSTVTRLSFYGPYNYAMTQGAPVNLIGVAFNNGNNNAMFQCVVANFPDAGIIVNNCYGAVIRDSYVQNCGGYGIEVVGSGKSLLLGNQVSGCILSGIWLVNSPHCSVCQNQVYQCGVLGYGIALLDSDNTEVVGNKVQQCAIGMILSIGTTRSSITTDVSYGYVATGNNIIRNYYGGILLSTCHGFNVTGNNVAENGQGGTDNNTFTAESGIVIDQANKGTGYLPGDILTVVGGTGTAAKAVVLRVGTGGAITSDGLGVVNAGSYTTLPPSNPCATTCIRGGPSGAKVILSASTFQGGAGYQIGQVLRASNGTFFNPVRVQVTAIGPGGAVANFAYLDGGGYTGPPPTQLQFTNDTNMPQNGPTDAGAGPVSPDAPTVPAIIFTLNPLWGLRYSQNGKFGGGISFGIATYGAAFWGTVSSNQIDWVRTGTGLLIADEASGPYHGRADYMNFVCNTLTDNHVNYTSATHNVPDPIFNPLHSQFASNLIYPAGSP